MSKKKWGESPHETVKRNAREVGLVHHKMTTGMTVEGTSTGRFIRPITEPHELIKCEHGLPPGFCRECAKSVSDIMMEHAVRYGIGMVDIALNKNIEPEDLFGMPDEHWTATQTSAERERKNKKNREHLENYSGNGPNIVHTMTEEEMMEEPLPEWAIGRAKGELVLGAQLPTRDGRKCGNAHITNIASDIITDEPLYYVLTDAGSTISNLNAREVDELFYPPVWVSDLNDIHRKFDPQPDPIANPYCCQLAEATRGWEHNTSCENWVLKY